jgi:hypothetical protein
MFHQGLVGDHGFIQSVENGDSNNFVWSITMLSESPELVMDQSGCSIFCQLPDQFV